MKILKDYQMILWGTDKNYCGFLLTDKSCDEKIRYGNSDIHIDTIHLLLISGVRILTNISSQYQFDNHYMRKCLWH